MAEKEYIEREAALGLIDRYWQQAYNAHFLDAAVRLGSACREMEDIPAADVRPVVLCKDCLHYEMGVCLKIYDDGAANNDAWQERKPDDFCSYGEDRNVPTSGGADMREEQT